MLFALILCLPVLGLQFPDLPEGSEQTRVWDTAGLFYETMEARMAEVQDKVVKEHDVAIWVVTIPSLASQKASALPIEQYAARLYDQKIRGTGANESSILFVISKADRKARIELGDDWGHDWDGECESIMQHSAVPSFRKGEYDVGTVLTLKALAKMVESRDNPTAGGTFKRNLIRMGTKYGPYSPLPPIMVVPLCALCVLVMICGAFSSQGRGVILGIGGTGLFVVLFAGGIWHAIDENWDGILLCLMIVGGALLIVTFGGGSGGGGGYYSSWDSGGSSFGGGGFDFGGGGGFGGGGFDFGGGGGATGSW